MSGGNVRPGAPGFPHGCGDGAKTPEEITDGEREWRAVRHRETSELPWLNGPTLSQIVRMLSRLTSRQRRVMIMRNGLTEEYPCPLSLVETAKECGCTRERIRILEAKAVQRIRELLEVEE